MKSTQKFLCYSLALVGAALIFSAGCKKGDNVTNYNTTREPTVIGPSPAALSGTVVYTAGGAISMSLAGAQDGIALAGASSVTTVGFDVYATGISTTAGATSTVAYGTANNPIAITATVPTGYMQTGSFSASLSTTASYAALSPCVTGGGTITWVVRSFATNAQGTGKSLTTTTIVTVN